MFSDNDPLIAIGPDNRTYWLMLLVRSEAIVHWKFIYYVVIVLEVILTLTGFYLHYRGAMLVWKYKFLHINFLILGMNVYGVMVIGSLARLVSILYETRIIKLPSLGYEPVPTLAILRQLSYAHAFCFLYVVTIERFCATWYVSDYERNKRMHISVILCIIISSSSTIAGYLIVTGYVNGILISAFALIPNIMCAIMFRRMLIHNKKRHASLTNEMKRRSSDEYSLSLRVQLKENIWSMQKIEFGVYALTIALTANLLIVFLPVYFLSDPAHFERLQWFTCAGNLSFSLTITTTAPLLEMIVEIHKGNIPRFLVRLFGRELFEDTRRKEYRTETDVYFIQLNNQWTLAMIPSKKKY